MKLSPTGRNRLEAMKRALAAGLPLAGLLAASAMVAPEALAGSVMELNGGEGLALKLAPDGRLVTEDGTPVVIVDMKTGETGEIVDRVRVFPGYLSGGPPPSDPSEDSAEEE